MALERTPTALVWVIKRERKHSLLTSQEVLWSLVKLALHKGLEMYPFQKSMISCRNWQYNKAVMHGGLGCRTSGLEFWPLHRLAVSLVSSLCCSQFTLLCLSNSTFSDIGLVAWNQPESIYTTEIDNAMYRGLFFCSFVSENILTIYRHARDFEPQFTHL